MQKIWLEDLEIEFTRKSIKNIHIRIHPHNGKINVSAPHKLAEKIIHEFLLSKLAWMREKQALIQSQASYLYNNAAQFNDGEKHLVFGQTYKIQTKSLQKSPHKVLLLEDKLVLYVKENANATQKYSLIKSWARDVLKHKIAKMIEHYEPLMQVKVKSFGVKQMKTKWGSCNVYGQGIWLNLELYKYPPICLEYVVVHEMLHILEPSHNKNFWSLVEHFMPNWRIAKNTLSFIK